MQNIRNSFMAVIVLVAFLVSGVPVALAAVPDGTGPWADEVISFDQGLRDDGSAVAVDRSDPANALGVAEGTDAINFVALGYGGELVLRFDDALIDGPGPDARIVETTYGDSDCLQYPERAKVWLSPDGVDWTPVGTGCQDRTIELSRAGLACAQYVKIEDVTEYWRFQALNVNHITDGYDVDGVEALHYQQGDCALLPEVNVGVMLDKSVEGFDGEGDYVIEEPTEVTYVYTVTNTGDIAVMVSSVEDSHCSPIEGPTGDTNEDELLDTDETWVYTCTQLISGTTTNKARVFVNDPNNPRENKAHDNAFFTVVMEGEAEESITICHQPGTKAEMTMVIPESAWSGHQGHGDYLGVCEAVAI